MGIKQGPAGVGKVLAASTLWGKERQVLPLASRCFGPVMSSARRNEDRWLAIRHRILAETEQYISVCLQRPELAEVIPVIPAGSGRFPPGLAQHFWQRVLVR